MVKAKGKGLLQVVGILLIIWSAFGIFSGVTSMLVAKTAMSDGGATLDAMNSILQSQGAKMITANGLMVASLITLVAAILDLVAGILGVAFCNKPVKSQANFILGILLILSALGTSVYNLTQGSFNIFTVILGLVLPVLYFIGANKNKQSNEESAMPADGSNQI